MKKNADDNEQNTQVLLFYYKIYNLGSSYTYLLLYVFLPPGGTSKGPFSDSSKNLE